MINGCRSKDAVQSHIVTLEPFNDKDQKAIRIWNPGRLPPTLTLEKLRVAHGSVPGNPLLAEPMYLTRYIERMGTGTRDMIRRCVDAGLPEPEFEVTDGFMTTIRRSKTDEIIPPKKANQVTGEVTGEVRSLLAVMKQESSRSELQKNLGLKSEANFRTLYLKPATDAGLVEMTIPEKPTSRLQKYRLTKKGRDLLAAMRKEE